MAELKLRFDADLPFQRDAINAVTELFRGQPLAESSLAVAYAAGPLGFTEFGTGNTLTLDRATLFRNLRDVQQMNEVPVLPPGLHGMEPYLDFA